jgi:hypothetical protein
MKIWLEIQRRDGTEHRDVTPDGKSGVADGECPSCNIWPFLIRGCGVPQDSNGIRKAGGYCIACEEPVGYIYAEVGSIFGPEEDAAILQHGRARVY